MTDPLFRPTCAQTERAVCVHCKLVFEFAIPILEPQPSATTFYTLESAPLIYGDEGDQVAWVPCFWCKREQEAKLQARYSVHESREARRLEGWIERLKSGRWIPRDDTPRDRRMRMDAIFYEWRLTSAGAGRVDLVLEMDGHGAEAEVREWETSKGAVARGSIAVSHPGVDALEHLQRENDWLPTWWVTA